MSAVETVLIAAVAQNGVIGRDNGMPFRLSSDLKRFKALTMGYPVVMGRLTFQSIGRPLPGRPNIVISGDPEFRAEGCEVYADLDTGLDRARMLAEGMGKPAIFVIGGGQIYAQTMDDADRLEITHLAKAVDGDTHFPTIDEAVWEAVERTQLPAGDKDDVDMTFVTYRRRSG